MKVLIISCKIHIKLLLEQVSIGILNQQTQILRQQNEIINKNQQNLSRFLTKPAEKPAKTDNNSQNLELLQEILRPVNSQIEEISRKYEELKQNIKESQSNMQNPIASEQISLQKHDLKENIENAIDKLDNLKPENSESIGKFSNNFDREAYGNSVQRIQGKMRLMEAELLRLEPIEKRSRETIEKVVNGIDFQESYANLTRKLGGEFDYCEFNREIEMIKAEFYNEIDGFRENNEKIADFMIIDHKDIENLLEKAGKKTKLEKEMGVLEEFKRKIGFDERKIRKKEIFDEKKQVFAKKTTNKPKNLTKIVSFPKGCPRDIVFKKKKEDFETIFDGGKKEKKQDFDVFKEKIQENVDFSNKKDKSNETFDKIEKNERKNNKFEEKLEENSRVLISGKKFEQEDSINE